MFDGRLFRVCVTGTGDGRLVYRSRLSQGPLIHIQRQRQTSKCLFRDGRCATASAQRVLCVWL